ncbi:MAG TPA: hypothetical protein VJ482_06510 [Acidimicrobiia bacterium]|nr:hypothetical protein [Acidimicrobiia bacterium]
MKGAAPFVTEAPWDAEEATVLRRFFEGTRLTQIPAHSKRLVILERLVQEFEPGMLYGVLSGCELVAGGW